MARKREERAVKQAYKKEKQASEYLSGDTFTNFSTQLAKLGLQLRDIPGDGNCLFRALGDQLEGHGRNHYKHRLDTVQYMKEHRKDFEPFVEDDVPFEKHVNHLKQPGTYAGNDAIVSFARLNKLKVVIHQLDSPCWQISGTDKPGARELHISYHNGDHYSSVRRIGDNTETPANIRLKSNSQKAESKPEKKSPVGAAGSYDCDNGLDSMPELSGELTGMARVVRNLADVEDHIMSMTGCMDRTLVKEMLAQHMYDVDLTIHNLLQMMTVESHNKSLGMDAYNGDDSGSNCSARTCDSGIWSENGTATRIFGSGPSHSSSSSKLTNGTGTKPKTKQLPSRDKRKQKKMEKQKRAEERHRQKVLGLNPEMDLSEEDEETVIHKEMDMLSL